MFYHTIFWKSGKTNFLNLSKLLQHWNPENRPFSYSAKEPGSSVIFIHFYTGDSIKWRNSFYHYCPHSKILQNEAKYRSIEILFQNS